MENIKSDKMQRFEELGEKRMLEVIKKIRLIGNLSNKNNYEYTEKHVKKIIASLQNEINVLENKFKFEDEKIEFKF